MGIGPRDHRASALQRLAQRLQRAAGEFRQLIQKQHALVSQRNLARLGPYTAADQGRQGRRMVGIAERPLAQQTAIRQ